MRRALRIAGLVVCALVLGLLQALVLALGFGRRPAGLRLPRVFHRMTCRLLGLRVHVKGTPATGRPTVWVCNHVSYLDVAVLGSLLPGRFVAKREVRQWPVFGRLATLQRTLFIGRRSTDSLHAIDALSAALDEGASLILFPEGTTTDGRDVARFRSAAFAPLAPRPTITIQPVTLRVRGGARTARPAPYAYIDDDVLVTHMLRMLGRASTDVDVIVHPPLPDGPYRSDRKALAGAAQGVVASAFVPARGAP